MYFIDSHCHLHDLEFFTPEKQSEILKTCAKNKVQKLICIGTSHQDSLSARDFASKHDNVFWAYGIHPSDLEQDQNLDFQQATEYDTSSPWQQDGQIPDQNPIAIGEVGLEYHYYSDNHAEQIHLFEQMLQLAINHNLPLIFHIREAFDDFFPIVDNFPHLQGVVHSFSDNKKNLKKALDHDFYIGVNGMATYSTLPLPPLERILLETDAPFLAPVPHRGEQNHPGFIPDIAYWLAQQHNVTLEAVAKQTTKNTETLFKI